MIKTIKKTHLILALTGLATVFAGVLLIRAHYKNAAAMQPIVIPLPKIYMAEQNSFEKSNPIIPTNTISQHKIVLKRHDKLRNILLRNHVASEDVKNLFKSHRHDFRNLLPKQTIEFNTDQQHHLISMKVPMDLEKTVIFTRTSHGYQQKTETLPLTTNLAYKSGVISASLTRTMQNVGMPNKMYQQFVNIFKAQVNFAHDIRRGDRFAVLYKEYYVNGQKFRPGEIVAAELTTQDKNLRAVRFSFSKNQTGYYTPKGNSLESRFLSYPLRFKHISSQFSYHRMDPISHLNRPHLGIDFSAENGTPVQAIGNGRITFVGNVNGYGKMIKVSFDRHYSAMYAHLARFASDLKINQEIHKGQTIGYVGSTGWSTGPHLHFGFFLNGVATNWLAMKPSAASIPSRYFKKFLATSHKILAELQFRQATKFAANNNTQLNSHATD